MIRGAKVWVVEVKDGNGDILDLFGPFISTNEYENWIKPRKALYPELYYESHLITPRDLKWQHPLDEPYGGLDRPKCEDCGRDLTQRDLDTWWRENGPEDKVPRCCEQCAEDEGF